MNGVLSTDIGTCLEAHWPVGSQKAKKPPLLFEQGLPVSKNICQQEGGGGQPPPPTVQRRPDSGD